jgi:aldehyde:ferredoxin oxidoreductase
MAEYGYAGEILKVDLSDGKTSKLATADYADKYIGGHGIAARLYWEMVPAEAGAYDPVNCLICANGPVTGFPGFAGFRWKICGKTPLGDPESFSYSNLGERWGSWLKYAGYDALVVQGKAEKPVYLFIHDGKSETRDASHLWGQTTFDASDSLKAELGKNVSVLTIGPAGENLIPYSIVLAEKGASGAGGMGAVMGSKNLKAIVIAAGDKRPVAANPERVRQLVTHIATKEPRVPIPSLWSVPGLTRDHACYGCGIGCSRQIYNGKDGRLYKSLCQASDLYNEMTIRYYGEPSGERLQATRLCDGYGIDTAIIQSMIEWLDACYQEGIVNEKNTGLPLSKVGSPEYIEKLTRMITYREGFGDKLARGTIAAAESIGTRAREMLSTFIATGGGEKRDYDPRLFITTALIYAMEPRRPIQQLHEVCSMLMMWIGQGGDKPGELFTVENFRKVAGHIWGDAIAADFSTYEGKALAARKLQDRVFAKESLVLCDLRWTMTQPFRYTGDGPTPVTETEIYSAITGKDIDEADLHKMGERIFNLQRAILLRQGRPGREGDRILEHFHTRGLEQGELFYNTDCLAPGPDGEIISKIGAVVDRDEFEKMKSEYYGMRGWDVETGLPTKAKFEELELDDVAADLAERGLLRELTDKSASPELKNS